MSRTYPAVEMIITNREKEIIEIILFKNKQGGSTIEEFTNLLSNYSLKEILNAFSLIDILSKDIVS